jgi:hypothetical protein
MVLAATLLAVALLLLAVPERGHTPRATARVIHRLRPRRPARVLQPARGEVTIAPHAASTAIPPSFFGLSTEYWSLPRYERHLTEFERVLQLLHVPGDNAMTLRIGGDSADHSYWRAKRPSVPRKSFALTSRWLSRVGALARSANLRVILDLNLAADSALMASQWARAAVSGLPPGAIAGFEIGNEPDLYRFHPWQLAPDFTARDYMSAYQSYREALTRSAPDVPLIGPSVSNLDVNTSWLADLIATAHGSLGALSAHRYPLSVCDPRSSRDYPTVPRLLDERATAGMAVGVRPAVEIAHSNGLPFRLSELNSVTCGGLRGVSDSFATALWAPDALFELLRRGVDAVNVHIRADAINGPFGMAKNGLSARPLLYGLILFARALGPDARVVNLSLHAKRSLHLKVWAVETRGNALRVLIVDKGSRPVRLDLKLPAVGPAAVERLLARSPYSRSGVTLDGQYLGRDGTWHGTPDVPTVSAAAGGYPVTIAAHSAALVTVRMRPIARIGKRQRRGLRSVPRAVRHRRSAALPRAARHRRH